MLKVIGIGDNVADKYIDTKIMYPGGNALNFSVYAKQLGARSHFIGVFGSDAEASYIMNVLKEIGVDISRSRQCEGENGYSKVIFKKGDRIFIGSNMGGVLKDHPILLRDEELNFLKDFDLVHTSCFSYMEEEIKKIYEIGVPISFDFAIRWNDGYLKRVCPYVKFSTLSCGHLGGLEEVKEVLKKVNGYGSSVVLGTMGSRGAMLYDGKEYYIQEPVPVEVVDTLGAGDSFITAFLLSYIEGMKKCEHSEEALIRESLAKGAVFASKTCMVDGAFGYGTSL